MLNYENVVETGSETDEDDRTLVSEDNGLANGGGGGGGGEDEELGGPAGVPTLEASPRVAHALLSSEAPEGQEGLQNHHRCWRLRDDADGHLNGAGESSRVAHDARTAAPVINKSVSVNCQKTLKTSGSNIFIFYFLFSACFDANYRKTETQNLGNFLCKNV